MTDKIDLQELRKKDKPVVIKKEDYKIDEEQKENGKIMDTMVKKEHVLRRSKKMFQNDPSLFLYRLPLNEQQMENVYNNLVKI